MHEQKLNREQQNGVEHDVEKLTGESSMVANWQFECGMATGDEADTRALALLLVFPTLLGEMADV